MRKRFLFFLVLFWSLPAFGKAANDGVGSVMLSPEVSLITPNNLVLSNSHFTVPYLESMTGFPLLRVQLLKKIISGSTLDIFISAAAGYGLYQGNVTLQLPDGSTQESYIHLHWFPFSGAILINYKIPDVPFVRPGVQISGGVDWLLQAGPIAGLSDSFWLPVMTVTPLLTFFESEHRPGDWFGGFTFGVSYHTAFSTSQSFNGWSIQIGQNILF